MIPENTVLQIEALLAKANGKRRERLLTLEGVLSRVDAAQTTSQWAWNHGGTVANAYGHGACTTLMLAARVDGKVYVGVAVSPAYRPSPGRAWKCLKPWLPYGTEDTPGARRFHERMRRWTQEPNVIEVGICPLDEKLGKS